MRWFADLRIAYKIADRVEVVTRDVGPLALSGSRRSVTT
jgi:hypothetical protein